MASTDHEPEVARPRAAHQTRRRGRREFVDNLLGIGAGLGHRSAERAAQLLDARFLAHGLRVEARALAGDELSHAREQILHSARRRFSSKMASIGPGSTSLRNAM